MQIVLGLVVILVVATAAWLVLAVVMTARGLRRPPRRGVARAIARGAPLAPHEAGWTAEEWFVRTEDGLDLPAWRWTTGADGPVTILLHDWGDSRISELQHAASFVDDSRELVVFDQRGHGEAPGECTLARDEVDDVLAVMRVLGDGPFRLVGYGLGATTALLVAGRTDIPVSEIVAIDPWPDDVDGVIARLHEAGLAIRPTPVLFQVASRLAGVDIPRVGPGADGPRISIRERDDTATIPWSDRLAREDVEVSTIRADTSSS